MKQMIRKWLMVAGLGLLAVPAALAGHDEKCEESTQTCLNMMAAELANKGWTGIEMDKDEASGLMKITRVVPDSPAKAGGFREGDLLFSVNGIEFNDANKKMLYENRKTMTPGQTAVYMVQRAGQKVEIKVSLAKVPESVLAQWVGGHMLEHALPTEVASK
jgi:predicted metalloprotease with PDZ domain